MTSRVTNTVLVIAFIAACALAQDQGQPRTVAIVSADGAPSATSLRQGIFGSLATLKQSSPYYWESTPVGDNTQLLTLICGACDVFKNAEQDVPLVSVLRDTLGDQTNENDRVTYVWLLTYAHPRLAQRFLSAIPFLYRRVGKGSGSVSKHDTVPFMDLSTPENLTMAQISRDLLQWTAFDPMVTPVRASTHEYNSNSLDDKRLHLQEAISYLRQAPVSNDSTALTQAQVDTVVGRLELRKTLLGGLASDKQAKRVGAQSAIEQERIRTRNVELLRQWAEKTRLLFEPLSLASNQGHYAILWFPQRNSTEVSESSLNSTWKLLGIRNPWNDTSLKRTGPVYERAFDENRSETVIPLAVYSLDYPRQPLLLIDFRRKLSERRREVAQRSVDELIAGVLGISHFTSWYFYMAFDLHRFVVGRRGTALDQASRLDCYSDFRINLALDQTMDLALRKDMENRIQWLAVNPLEAAPQREIQDAIARYELLEQEAENGRLMARVDEERRFELSSFGETEKTKLVKSMLHVATFGLYKQQAKGIDIFILDRERRVAYQLSFLDSLVQAETPPEIAYDSQRIRSSVRELSRLIPTISSPAVRSHTEATLEHLKNLSQDDELMADCAAALAVIKQTDTVKNAERAGIATFSREGTDAYFSNSEGTR